MIHMIYGICKSICYGMLQYYITQTTIGKSADMCAGKKIIVKSHTYVALNSDEIIRFISSAHRFCLIIF